MKKFVDPPIGLRYELPGIEATGLIVRRVNGVPLGYFFPFRIADCPDSEIIPDHAIYIALHNYVPFFIKNEIEKSHLLEGFDERDWPFPTFIHSTQSGRGQCPGDLKSVARKDPRDTGFERIGPSEKLGYTSDHGYHSLGIVAVKIRRILESGQINAGRAYTLPDPMPNGGKLLNRFMEMRSETRTS